MAARRRRRPPSLRSALVFACGFAAGGLAGASLQSPRLWLLRLSVPVETVDLRVSSPPAPLQVLQPFTGTPASRSAAAEPPARLARSGLQTRRGAPAASAAEPVLAAAVGRSPGRAALDSPPLPKPSLREVGAPPSRPVPSPPTAAPRRPDRAEEALPAQPPVRPPRAAGVRPPRPSPPEASRPPASRASGGRETGGSRRIVQVVATPHRDRARELARELRQQGFDAYLERRGKLVHVRVRPARSESVQRTESRLGRLGYETRILPE